MSFSIRGAETALALRRRGPRFSTSIFPGAQTSMLDIFTRFTQLVRRPAFAAVVLSALVLPALTVPSLARGLDNIADVAEQVIDAVVNISTSQRVESRNNAQTPPQLPNNPQSHEPFREFFNRRGQGGANPQPRRTNSLGSGFIIHPSGSSVTNNHVIAA